MRSLGGAVRHLRRQRGITLEELADAADMDAGNLSKFERGTQGTADERIAKIAKFFGISVSELVKIAESLVDETSDAEPSASAADSRGASSVVAVQEPPAPWKRAHFQKAVPVPVIPANELAVIESPSKLDAFQAQQSLHVADVSPRCFAMRVPDDTMTAPPGAEETYPIGHYAIFDPTLQHESRDAVLLKLGPNQFTFTSLMEVSGSWMMTPLNTRYPPRELPLNARVLAVAVGVQAITRKRR